MHNGPAMSSSNPAFTKLNDGWNADPNAPEPRVRAEGADVGLMFRLNTFRFPQTPKNNAGVLRFHDCSRHRLGPTNDEGWYRGQCRYSAVAPKWGEFYEIVGDDALRDAPADWVKADGSGARHFLFYLRDHTFEAIAAQWSFEMRGPEPARAGDWKNQPLCRGVPIPYTRAFSAAEFLRLQQGLIPREMEDKWFIYYEPPYLHFHRSWTGLPAYRVLLAEDGGGASVSEALRDPNSGGPSHDDGQHAQLLNFLIGNLLLGEAKPSPRPPDRKKVPKGLLQHSVSGTGYSETVGAKRPWWKFWA